MKVEKRGRKRKSREGISGVISCMKRENSSMVNKQSE